VPHGEYRPRGDYPGPTGEGSPRCPAARDAQGRALDGTGAGRCLCWHYTKVSKLETGDRSPSEDDIRAWCAACGTEGQVFPRRRVRDCCYYHRQDFHAIAAAVNAAHRQLRRSGLGGDDADELKFRLLEGSRLSEDERSTALLLLAEDCGIQIVRWPGERRWTYHDGRHRARALMDAGVHRILITVTADRRSQD